MKPDTTFITTLSKWSFLVVLLIIGIVFLKNKRIVWAPVVAVVFGLLFIQFATLSEYEADRLAVSHISDPNGMITATARFKNDHALVLDDDTNGSCYAVLPITSE